MAKKNSGKHQGELDRLIGHTIRDTSFREQLLANPEATLAEHGYEVSPKVVDKIKASSDKEGDIHAASDSYQSLTGVPDDDSADPG